MVYKYFIIMIIIIIIIIITILFFRIVSLSGTVDGVVKAFSLISKKIEEVKAELEFGFKLVFY